MSRSHRRTDLSRRAALRYLAAAPAAAVLGAAAAAEPEPSEAPPPPRKPTPYAKLVAKESGDLTGAERKKLLEQAPGLEGTLGKLRDFPLAQDVEPAFAFRALRSRREGRR